ncbi:PHB depolymerase family esterase [Plantactinospora sp. B24E8]|uniref:extracellular catalytic domain type 1 short-chain-length polyhydroxyalkanoate depolymerase n=1 Tax=Plantactinospora sp. B24E8 TaxID=3153567 RepID=UPI00325F3572
MNRRTRAGRNTTVLVLAVAGVLTAMGGCDLVRSPGREAGTPPPAASAAPTRPAATASAPENPAVAPGSSVHRVTVHGRSRTFRLYRPTRLSLSTPVPLVVMLHGALGSGRQAETTYGWNAVADRHGFVVAYPDGLNRSWAVSPDCCGSPARDGVDDVAFIAETVATVSARLPVDPDRIYATGISNGGMLAYRLACDTTTFAAIGVVAGTLLGPCPTPAPISLLHIHGTADGVIPYDGRPGVLDNRGAGPLPVRINGGPVSDQIDRWRELARCPTPEVRTTGVVTSSLARCPDGRDVDLITVAGAGHQWPGATQPIAERLLGLDPPSTALTATESIWTFFDAHPRVV